MVKAKFQARKLSLGNEASKHTLFRSSRGYEGRLISARLSCLYLNVTFWFFVCLKINAQKLPVKMEEPVLAKTIASAHSVILAPTALS